MSSVKAIKSRLARFGRRLEHLHASVRFSKSREIKPTTSNTRAIQPRTSSVSDLSPYNSIEAHRDDNRLNDPQGGPTNNKSGTRTLETGHTNDAVQVTENNSEGRNRLYPSALFGRSEVEAGLKVLSDFTDRFSGVLPGRESQRHQSTQPSSLKVTPVVKSNPTTSISLPPWVAEKVHFVQEFGHKFPPGFINRGSFGSVFLVRHKSRGDLAALKIVKIGKGDSDFLAKEIAALMRIREGSNRFVLRQPLGVGDVIWTSDSGHLHLLFVSAHSVVRPGVFLFLLLDG
jgi:hypothetical protein